MVKYAQRYDKQALTVGIKEKIAIVVGVVILIFSYFNFIYEDKTPYGYAEVPKKLDSYLRESDYYSKEYKSGKMLVVYYEDRDESYKYEKSFMDALTVVMQDEAMKELYEFRAFRRFRNNMMMDDDGQKVLKGEKMLKKNCRKFCVINPKKKELYFYFEPSQRDTQYLKSNLEKLEFWGMNLD